MATANCNSSIKSSKANNVICTKQGLSWNDIKTGLKYRREHWKNDMYIIRYCDGFKFTHNLTKEDFEATDWIEVE